MRVEETFKLMTKKPHILSLVLLSAFASMGATLMTPALPSISAFFHVSMGSAQLTVTSFLFGYAVGQLLYGPIANRFGRKPAFYMGIIIATVGSLFSILASPIESFDLLILGRFLEATGASAGLVIAFTMINDFYFPEQSRKVVGMMILAFSIVPGVAVTLGGVFAQYLGWQACFYFLLLYGLILFYPATSLPETLVKPDLRALHYQHVFQNYLKMFKNKRLIGYSMIYGFSSGCVYLFGAAGPFIGIQVLHLPAVWYGFVAILPYAGTCVGSIITIQLPKASANKMLAISFGLEVFGAVAMLICFACGWINLLSLLLPLGILFLGHAILVSNASTLAMGRSEDKANGSAVMNFSAILMAVLLTFLLGIMHVAATWGLPILLLFAMVAMVVVYFVCLRGE